MRAQAQKAKVTVECSFDERAYIKMLAANKKVSISEYMLSHVRKDFPKEKIPNAETIAAMKEIEEGGGIKCESIDDFWKKMGIDRSAP